VAQAATKSPAVETYVMKVDAKHEAHYGNGAYTLHYLFGPDGNCKGVFSGGMTARRWIKKYKGTPEGIVDGAILFEANMEKPVQSY
jgi:hypothetical protein